MNEIINNKIQGGYIITPRKFFQSPFWLERRKFSHAEALQDLIQMASWEEKVYVPSIYNQIKLRRGEFATSYRQLSKRWKWGITSVKRFLDYLQNSFTIKFKSGTGGGTMKEKQLSTIFIVNYDLYQDTLIYEITKKEQKEDHRANTARTGEEQQRNKTNKMINKIKENDNKSKNTIRLVSTKRTDTSFPKDWYKQVIDKYQSLKGITLQGKEFLPVEQTCKTMFLSGRTPDQIIACMEFLNGANSEIYQNWTIRTIFKKLPEYLAGKLTL